MNSREQDDSQAQSERLGKFTWLVLATYLFMAICAWVLAPVVAPYVNAQFEAARKQQFQQGYLKGLSDASQKPCVSGAAK